MKVFAWISAAVLLVITLLMLLMYLLGQHLADSGRDEAAWLMQDNWKTNLAERNYTPPSAQEKLYLASVAENAHKNQPLIDRLLKEQCNDTTWECALVTTAKANLAITNGDLQNGLTQAAQASSQSACPILFETSIALTKAIELAQPNTPDREQTAQGLIRKLQADGGVLNDLRTPACQAQLEQAPYVFAQYAITLAKVMEYGDSPQRIAAAYIRSTFK